MFTDDQLEEIVELLLTLDESKTKIYLGCDSVRYIKGGKKFARFATVLIVHKNGKDGCRMFWNKSEERDYDAKPNKPKMRMMAEVQKVCELYLQVAPLIQGFGVEIHLDINVNPMHGSNCAAKEAAGYVLGTTGIDPMLKPNSFGASFGADHIANGKAG